MPKTGKQVVSIGLRAKTARAIAVVLGGPLDSPRVIKRTEIKLADPAVPATGQPYHEVMDLPWEKAQSEVRKIAVRIEKIAAKELANLVREAEREGLTVCGVGIVGAGDRKLEKIGSTHIRAHAAEGVLFRQVLETAAHTGNLPGVRFDERSLEPLAAPQLGLSHAELKGQLAALGRQAGSPWRADEKAAATAAWLVLKSTGMKKQGAGS